MLIFLIFCIRGCLSLCVPALGNVQSKVVRGIHGWISVLSCFQYHSPREVAIVFISFCLTITKKFLNVESEYCKPWEKLHYHACSVGSKAFDREMLFWGHRQYIEKTSKTVQYFMPDVSYCKSWHYITLLSLHRYLSSPLFGCFTEGTFWSFSL